MNLPHALAPWAPFLEEFPIEVAFALGTMANRLAALLGPLGSEFDQHDGEVDGYDGLTRRGLPERMITSDWLLAQEAPDEWARRAAEGELSYLQLARKAPQQSKVIGVIFDAGPEVLGAPRLGELALFLVLARRAHQMNTQLIWGVVQKNSADVWKEFTLSGVRSLMEARSSASVTADKVEAWREALSECEEKWLVGSAEMVALAKEDESIVRIDDSFDASRCIEVMVRSVHHDSRQARLELPPDAMCTRLMRDPFEQKRETSGGIQLRQVGKRSIPVSNPVWVSPNALAATTKENHVIVFRVPAHPRGGVAKPKHFQINDANPVLYVGAWKSGAYVAGTARVVGIYLHHIGSGGGIHPGQYKGDFSGAADILRPFWNLRSDTEFRPFLLSRESGLCRIEFSENQEEKTKGVVKTVVPVIVAAEGFEKGIVAFTSNAQGNVVRLQSDPRQSEGFQLLKHDFPKIPIDKNVAFWGFGGGFEENLAKYGVFAHKTAKEWKIEWTDAGNPRTSPIEVPEDEDVMGVIGSITRWPAPGLLIRGAQKRGLRLRGAGWNHTLEPNQIINAVTVSPVSPCIAWTTPTELVVYSLAQDVVLARWQWGASE